MRVMTWNILMDVGEASDHAAVVAEFAR